MLTEKERLDTREELQENYNRLGFSEDKVCREAEITKDDLTCVLNMEDPNPADVWKIRDYLEDMLIKENKEVFPFRKMKDHSVNKWFPYETPWRDK